MYINKKAQNVEEKKLRLKKKIVRLKNIAFTAIILLVFFSGHIRVAIDNNTPVFSNIKVLKLNKGMNTPRSNYQSSLTCNGKILITGGSAPGKKIGLGTTEIYDEKEQTFAIGPKMNLAHVGHSQFLLPDCNIVIVDTNGIETYDARTNKFVLWENSPSNVAEYIGGTNYTLINNHNILLSGGLIDDKGTQKITNIALLLDLKNKKITRVANMLSPRAYHASLMMDKKVYLVGGKTNVPKGRTPYLNNIEFYDEMMQNFLNANKEVTRRQEGFVALNIANNEALIMGGGPWDSYQGILQSEKSKHPYPIEKLSINKEGKIALNIENYPKRSLNCKITNTWLSENNNAYILSNPFLYKFDLDNKKFNKVANIKKYNMEYIDTIKLSNDNILVTSNTGVYVISNVE